MAMIVSKKGNGGTRLLEKSHFGKEDNLQEYIHDHLEAIPVYDIHKDKRLLVVGCSPMESPRLQTHMEGHAEKVFLDQRL
jgi:hypothetical protein